MQSETVLKIPAVHIENVRKVYGPADTGVVALEKIDLEIKDNEFFTLLGPSGCGKTTLLHMLAGFQDATSGSIRLFGEEISELPPNKRPVNTVFQHYALFPHMTVAKNIAFGLERLKVDQHDIRNRVNEMLELAQLSDLRNRRPSELSGGQQQRVAMARALAPRPKVLLLDEPLSALDLKLRQAMRVELKRIQRESGITFIFVTHDQEEALTMSDRIAVIAEGRIKQLGTPISIYEEPNGKFVAEFIGDTNLIKVTIDKIKDGKAVCLTRTGAIIECALRGQTVDVDQADILIRPERLSISKGLDREKLGGRVVRIVYLGTDTQVIVEQADHSELMVRMQNTRRAQSDIQVGDEVSLIADSSSVQLLID